MPTFSPFHVSGWQQGLARVLVCRGTISFVNNLQNDFWLLPACLPAYLPYSLCCVSGCLDDFRIFLTAVCTFCLECLSDFWLLMLVCLVFKLFLTSYCLYQSVSKSVSLSVCLVCLVSRWFMTTYCLSVWMISDSAMSTSRFKLYMSSGIAKAASSSLTKTTTTTTTTVTWTSLSQRKQQWLTFV